MGAITVEILPILSDNYAYVLRCSATGAVGVVDPGEAQPVERAIGSADNRLDWVFLTHHHADHIAGAEALREAFGAKIVGAAHDRERLPALDLALREGDRAPFGGTSAQIFETPGHARGHIVYWFEADRLLFTGDVMFVMGCGRLFEGSADEMWSAFEKLAALPDDAKVYCGHEYSLANARFAAGLEPDRAETRERADEIERARAEGAPTVPSTLAAERRSNPYLRAADPALARALGLTGADPARVFAEIRSRKDRA